MNLTELLHYLSDIETLLIATICLFSLLALVLFTAIMVYRSIKISDLSYIATLQEQYDELFMNAAFADPDQLEQSIKTATTLNKVHLKNKRHAHIISNQLLHLYNSFSGESKDNLREIYTRTGFIEHSEKKIRSYRWEVAAQGIRELATMKKSLNVLQSIKKLGRLRNKIVVENVQLSMVKINGFEGLDFLDETTEPISDWQQINLIEALKEYSTATIPDFRKWLQSKEKTVVLFAVRLIRYFKKIDNSDSLKVLLKHKDDKIKAETIQTLAEFGNREILDDLVDSYNRESHTIQIEIIKAYAALAASSEIGVLPLWIKRTNHMEIQKTCIEAAIALHALEELKQLCMSDLVLQTRVKAFMSI